VLELVREFQAVETELGYPQTQVEVAMDDWALATVADLEDRTRVRGVSGAVVAVSSHRRRRRVAAVQGEYSPVGTLLRQSNPAGGPRSRSTGTSPNPRGRGMQILAWALVGCAALVIALAAVATLVLIRAGSSDIPVVSDIDAEVQDETLTFTWQDPGIGEDASYQVEVDGGSLSVQKSESFQLRADPGDHVCLVVTVSEGGRLGSPSSPKCVDVPE